jgi:energy-coupling factor transporter transmembrane protein EcfT
MIIFGLSVWLWISLAVLISIGIWIFERDTTLLTAAVFAIALLLLEFGFGMPIKEIFADNPLVVVLWAGAYFIIGALYSVFWKWRLYCNKHSEFSPGQFEDFLNMKNLAKTEKAKAEFLSNEHYNKLHPKNHLNRLTNWILFWPLGVLWSLLHDPITWLATSVRDAMASQYEQVSQSAVNKKL